MGIMIGGARNTPQAAKTFIQHSAFSKQSHRLSRLQTTTVVSNANTHRLVDEIH